MRPLLRSAARLADYLPPRVRTPLEARYFALAMPKGGGNADLAIATALLPKGATVLDVGANVGWWARPFAEAVGPGGHVEAVEPLPATAAILRYGVRRLPQVRVHEAACSDAPGAAWLEIPRWANGHPNRYEARLVAKASTAPGPATGAAARPDIVAVTVTTLDALWADLGRPDVALVKIDVEGHEGPVLQGAAALLASREAAWVVEVTTPRIFPLLTAHGYGVWQVVGGRLVPRVRERRTANYWFLTERHVARCRTAGVVG
jgi:FkbM family methyltransferase